MDLKYNVYHPNARFNGRYMKTVDQFNNKLVSTFITAGSIFLSLKEANIDIKMMLLHETRNDDGIRAFFSDVWECYVKTLLNPFYAIDKPIKSATFESKVRAIAKVDPHHYSANNSATYKSFRPLSTFPLTKSLDVFLF